VEEKTLADFKGFKTMDRGHILKLLEGHEDIITPAAKAQQEKLQGHDCPYCGSPLDMVLQPKPFGRGVLPKFMGECKRCKVSGILIDG
jgi:hypothetical protein